MRVSPAKSSVSRAISLLSSRASCDAASSSYSTPAFAFGQHLRKGNGSNSALVSDGHGHALPPLPSFSPPNNFGWGARGYRTATATASALASRGFSSGHSPWRRPTKYLQAPPSSDQMVQTQVREFNKHKRRSGYYPTLKKTWDRELPPEVDELNLDLPEEYTVTGTITEKYKRPEAAEIDAFAVIELAGKQYKVVADDLLFVDRRSDLEINDIVECNRVLLLGTREETVIGRPYIDTASVTCCVESQFMEEKKIIFKKKRRKGYRRNNGFRHRLTRLRILKINNK